MLKKTMETPATQMDAAEKQLILLTLNDYLEGRPVLDLERLRRAFHPNAYIRTTIEGKLVQWALPQYLDLVGKATVQECQPELISYTWDGDTASAQVQLTFATFRFIDRFNLMKLGGRWQIVDKVSYRQEL
ncbi:nuclear transport factor 2 family protein [Chitinophaga sp. Cy-1792]|uniref:nuclear transport factor 2 family protein n=1 Tax=Chitinophaga sp. Cy-1792 TaxID=2608339 RepID=UPI00141EF88B|nr:nuclear transport factor 2 family protein [Chitinophaga sp. Cy-1792]NIG55729.1 nuclear transport factor 2 family protein [Chitinophaga sp. Cy-1792]